MYWEKEISKGILSNSIIIEIGGKKQEIISGL